MPLIESKLGAAETYVGGITYKFQRDQQGRFVCSVTKLSHAEQLVSAGTYRQIDRDDEPQTPPVAPDGDDDETLLVGSGSHRDIYEIGGRSVQLGEVVRHAKIASLLSADAWNQLPDTYREALIDVALEDLGFEAPEPEDLHPQQSVNSGIRPRDDEDEVHAEDDEEQTGEPDETPARPPADKAPPKRPGRSSKAKKPATAKRQPPKPRSR